MSLVRQVIPLGANTVDLMMKFDIKETDCAKASGSDPQTCAFRSGFFVVRDSMSSGVTSLIHQEQFLFWCSVVAFSNQGQISPDVDRLIVCIGINVPGLNLLIKSDLPKCDLKHFEH